MDDNDCDIRVDVATSYVDDQSEPDADRYVFAYTITISNDGNEPATLRSRHWIITDANGKVQEVTGDGVVGEQPHLNPGERFRYSSGAVIETPPRHNAEYGIVQALLRDPDGHLLEIQRFDDPDWASGAG